MNYRAIGVAIVLAITFGAANALTIKGTGWMAQLRGFEDYPVNVSLTGHPSTTQVATLSFRVEDGFFIPKVELELTYDGQPQDTLHFYLNSLFFDMEGLEPGAIVLTDSKSDGAFPFITYGTPIPENGVKLVGSNMYFNGGTGLNPSSDPSCTNVACRVPYTMRGLYRLTFGVHTIPEPSTIVLCLSGLAIAIFALRTSGSRRS